MGRARWFLFLLLLVVGFLGYDWIRLSAIGSNRYAGQGWKFPTRVYADWREWKIGDRVAEDDLRDALERARYRRVWKKPAAPGEYRVRGATYDLRLRPFVFPEHVERGGEVSATIGGGTLSTLTEGFEDSRPRGILRIEPELLAEFSDLERERRSFVPLNEIPRHVVQAVVASEDRRFFRHYGIDLLGLGRATMRNANRFRVAKITPRPVSSLSYWSIRRPKAAMVTTLSRVLARSPVISEAIRSLRATRVAISPP